VGLSQLMSDMWQCLMTGGRGGGYVGIDRLLFCGSSELCETSYVDKVLNLN
jgi:hypothetical protein